MKRANLFAVTALLLLASCAPAAAPAIDEATVIARFAAVRQRNSSTSPTLRTLEPGDKVEVLEQQGEWYLIRLGDLQGWMQQATLVTKTTQARIESTVAASQGMPAQNTAVLTAVIHSGMGHVKQGHFTLFCGSCTPQVVIILLILLLFLPPLNGFRGSCFIIAKMAVS